MNADSKCERCKRSLKEHFPFAGTGLGMVREQGVFDGKPGPYCPLNPTKEV